MHEQEGQAQHQRYFRRVNFFKNIAARLFQNSVWYHLVFLSMTVLYLGYRWFLRQAMPQPMPGFVLVALGVVFVTLPILTLITWIYALQERLIRQHRTCFVVLIACLTTMALYLGYRWFLGQAMPIPVGVVFVILTILGLLKPLVDAHLAQFYHRRPVGDILVVVIYNAQALLALLLCWCWIAFGWGTSLWGWSGVYWFVVGLIITVLASAQVLAHAIYLHLRD